MKRITVGWMGWSAALCAAGMVAAACLPLSHPATAGGSSSSGATATPAFTFTPARCDFGTVEVGAQFSMPVTLKNSSVDRRVTVLSLLVTPVSSAEFFLPAYPLPVELVPGAVMTGHVGFSPTLAGENAPAALRVITDDPVQPGVDIPLTGAGRVTPAVCTGVAVVESVNGVPATEPSPQAHPLDTVVLTGAGSVASSSARSITRYHWHVVAHPMESTAVLTTPDAVTTGFRLDVGGSYVFGLTVDDGTCPQSPNPAQVTLNAVPVEDVHLQLTWEEAATDLDLHVLRGAGEPFSAEDCSKTTCVDGQGIHWGADGGATPRLILDDSQGFGPEVTVFHHPAAGDYTVGVHWNAGSAMSTVATVKVYVEGALLGEYTRQMTHCNEFWRVVTLRWSAQGVPHLTSVDTVVRDTHGSCP